MNSSAARSVRHVPPSRRERIDTAQARPSHTRALLAALVPHDEKEERLLTEQAKKALAVLECDSFDLGRLVARQLLHENRACPRCREVRTHLAERVGSTLFIDDDPEVLERAFSPEVRCACVRQTLAACVLDCGRLRVAARAAR